MAAGRPARVYLTGDREGAYIVSEERGDGSLVLTPDRSRRARAAEPAGPLASGPLAQLLLGRRQDRFPTSRDALDAWGVDLLADESVAEFALADVDKQHGFVAVTDRRFIFLVRSGASLRPRLEQPLERLISVEPLGRRGLLISWKEAEPTVVESRDRGQIERLRTSLLAHTG